MLKVTAIQAHPPDTTVRSRGDNLPADVCGSRLHQDDAEDHRAALDERQPGRAFSKDRGGEVRAPLHGRPGAGRLRED